MTHTTWFTKNVTRDKMNQLLEDLGYRFEEGRAQGAVELYDVGRQDDRRKSNNNKIKHGNLCENTRAGKDLKSI